MENLKEMQKKEAIERMKMLDIYPMTIEQFRKENKISYSINGANFHLENELKKMVSEWEEKTGNAVYFGILGSYEYGKCLSVLYVSKYIEEWEMEREYIKSNYPYAYVFNMSIPRFSEGGIIGVKKHSGGLVRVA